MIRIRELLYPSRDRELRTDLRPADAERALSSGVEPRRWLRFGSGGKTFQGTVGAGAFDIQRIISYRNSFLPNVRGTIREDGTGSLISISMRLPPLGLVILAIWVLLGVMPLLAPSASHEAKMGGIALLGLSWLITIGCFHFEAAKAQRALLRIFDASLIGTDAASPR
jgi:hypothetical protein